MYIFITLDPQIASFAVLIALKRSFLHLLEKEFNLTPTGQD